MLILLFYIIISMSVQVFRLVNPNEIGLDTRWKMLYNGIRYIGHGDVF